MRLKIKKVANKKLHQVYLKHTTSSSEIGLMSCGSKDIYKNALSVFCTNIHHGVTIFIKVTSTKNYFFAIK